MTLDIESAKEIAELAARVIDEHPALNVLINNAGIMRMEPLAERRDLGDAKQRSQRTCSALVTGAGSGICRAAALKFAREGAAIVLAGRREAELAAVAVMMRARGPVMRGTMNRLTSYTRVFCARSGAH